MEITLWLKKFFKNQNVKKGIIKRFEMIKNKFIYFKNSFYLINNQFKKMVKICCKEWS